jgi:hypothetical protein
MAAIADECGVEAPFRKTNFRRGRLRVALKHHLAKRTPIITDGCGAEAPFRKTTLVAGSAGCHAGFLRRICFEFVFSISVVATDTTGIEC